MPGRVHKLVLLRRRSSLLSGFTACLIALLFGTLFAERVTTSQSQQSRAAGGSNPTKLRTTHSSTRSRKKEPTQPGRANAATKAGPARPNLANERTLYVV